MNDLSVDRLGKWIGERVLFRDVSFGLQHGQRVALVARNGAGKTSLLNLIAGHDAPDAGAVAVRKGATLAYLEQQPTLDPSHTVLQAVLAADTPAQRAVAAYEAALEHAEAQPDDPRTQAALQAALAEVDHLGAWDYEADVRAVLSRLNIHHLDQPVAQLSGGQQRRLALARVLLQRPDILLMDEPTNHLDIDMVEWLEGWLTSRPTTLLLVTHDRYFLEAVCDTIYELADERIYIHQGSYADFLENQAKRLADATASADKARNLLRTELEWMRRQPKARGTKSQARINAFYDLEAKAQGPRAEDKLDLNVQMARLGSQVLEVEGLSKRFGSRTIVQDWTYTFRKGERVGIVGINGVGKSTLLNLLTGQLAPDAGRVTVGETIVFGYYTQTGLQFRPEERVIDVVKAIAEVIPVGREQTITAEQFLQRFQFAPKRQYTPVGLLSGGERRRLHLLTILVRQPNFLILDEPTNDLDLPTLQVLEDWLASYSGCLVIVTHDRYFLDRLTDHLLVLDGSGTIQDWNGNYTAWRTARDEAALAAKSNPEPAPQPHSVAPPQPTAPPPASPNAPAKPPTKLSYREQQEYQRLETEIASLETQLAELAGQLSGGGGHADLARAAQQYESLQAELDQKSLRWMELAERTA